jgi:hypothetical protein
LVVNVNSPAAQIPWPGAVGYTSARWAMRGFDAALRADLRQSGIGVTHLVAGKVSSEYWLHNPGSEEQMPAVARLIPTWKPEQVAEAICGAVERERREVVVPLMLRVFYWSERFMPRFTEWLVWRTGHDARRPGKRGRAPAAWETAKLTSAKPAHARAVQRDAVGVAISAVVASASYSQRAGQAAPAAWWMTGEPDGYLHSEDIDGSKSFGVWPLSQAAKACFSTPGVAGGSTGAAGEYRVRGRGRR